ncbi:MAG: DUF4838 domain-containing protein, partial [Clostridia bacterium]|nr:DUF4838 domain-containing protein [Clostridia bacterium]
YYNWYYDHYMNTHNRTPEPISADTVLQWKRQCEAEISKRGLQFHDMGHGWTAESFGISSTEGWVADTSNPIPEESKEFVAMMNGERQLYGGVALNTNFCMSNAEARKKVVDKVAEYAALNTNVDYLHVWLADGYNNHCECDNCRKMIPSDWYVMLMNEIDERLTVCGLDTRIVFCCYVDTTWPCKKVTLNNPERFTLLLGAISRDYTLPVSPERKKIELKPFILNKNILPATVDEYNAYANEWQRRCGGLKVLVYEYHFWRHQYYDPSGLKLARLIYDDIIGYKKNGFDGIVEDGSQRSFFPNGFAWYVYANTLFDTSCDFDSLRDDYYSHAYGDDWQKVLTLMEKTAEAMDRDFLERETKGGFLDPSQKEKLESVKDIKAEFDKYFETHLNSHIRVQTVATRLLEKFFEYCEGIAAALIYKCMGEDKKANEMYFAFLREFGKYEVEIERYFDQALAAKSLCGIFKSENAYHN